jgi:hypothetical protein
LGHGGWRAQRTRARLHINVTGKTTNTHKHQHKTQCVSDPVCPKPGPLYSTGGHGIRTGIAVLFSHVGCTGCSGCAQAHLFFGALLLLAAPAGTCARPSPPQTPAAAAPPRLGSHAPPLWPLGAGLVSNFAVNVSRSALGHFAAGQGAVCDIDYVFCWKRLHRHPRDIGLGGGYFTRWNWSSDFAIVLYSSSHVLPQLVLAFCGL